MAKHRKLAALLAAKPIPKPEARAPAGDLWSWDDVPGLSEDTRRVARASASLAPARGGRRPPPCR